MYVHSFTCNNYICHMYAEMETNNYIIIIGILLMDYKILTHLVELHALYLCPPQV